MTPAAWICTTLAVARAMTRTGFRVPFIVRRGLLVMTGRRRPRGGLAAHNDNARGAASGASLMVLLQWWWS